MATATTSHSPTTTLVRARRSFVGLGLLGVALMGACSTESLLESSVEEAIERSSDSAEVDFDADSGSLTVRDGDETVSLDFDDNGGSISVTDPAGKEERLDLDLTNDGGSLTITEGGERETYTAEIDDQGLVISDGESNEVLSAGVDGDSTPPRWFPEGLTWPQNTTNVVDAGTGSVGGVVGNVPGEPAAALQQFRQGATDGGWSLTEQVDGFIGTHPQHGQIEARFVDGAPGTTAFWITATA